MASGILIVKLGALGDVIMATALVDRILAHHAPARVVLLTTPAFAPVFRDWPGLEVRTGARHGLRATCATIAWIRAQQFARVYDLQSNDRSALWCAASGIAERVGNHPRFPYTHHPDTVWRGDSHIFTRMNAVLAAAGVPPAVARPMLRIGADAARKVAAWCAARGLVKGSYALLHAGASARRVAKKRWPHFAALGRALESAGVTPVWIGAGADAGENARLAAAVGLDATDAFGIPELAALAADARAAFSNDSGPMHAFAAADIPVYGFFGPTDWRRNHALGQADRVFADADLAAISADVVVARLRADRII
jgi:ADP-heptose:LPS heptosyltransferase